MDTQNKKRNTLSSELSNHPAFFDTIASIIENARRFIGRTADLTLCVTYYEIGRMIVEEEQLGKPRAEYGRGMLVELSAFLNQRVGKGFSETNLKNARIFYRLYKPLIGQLITDQSEEETETQIRQLMTDESNASN